MIEELFLVSNIICAIGTTRLLRRLIKNRKILKDYDLLGSFLTFIACLGFDLGFLLMGQIPSFAFGLYTALFWLSVTLVSFWSDTSSDLQS